MAGRSHHWRATGLFSSGPRATAASSPKAEPSHGREPCAASIAIGSHATGVASPGKEGLLRVASVREIGPSPSSHASMPRSRSLPRLTALPCRASAALAARRYAGRRRFREQSRHRRTGRCGRCRLCRGGGLAVGGCLDPGVPSVEPEHGRALLAMAGAGRKTVVVGAAPPPLMRLVTGRRRGRVEAYLCATTPSGPPLSRAGARLAAIRRSHGLARASATGGAA